MMPDREYDLTPESTEAFEEFFDTQEVYEKGLDSKEPRSIDEAERRDPALDEYVQLQAESADNRAYAQAKIDYLNDRADELTYSLILPNGTRITTTSEERLNLYKAKYNVQ